MPGVSVGGELRLFYSKVFMPLAVVFILLFPFWVFAANFSRDLYVGLRNDTDVKALQEFLLKQGLYLGPVNGNFFSLTKEAVKKFQQREKIEPVLGFFGLKTRTRANVLNSSQPQSLSKEDLVARLQVLQDQLKALQEKLDQEKAAAAVVSVPANPIEPTPTPVVATTSPAESKPTWINVSGQATSTFPEIEASFFKLGEFKVYNGLDSEALFSNFELEVVDEMESTPNRNHKISFLLRDGLASVDPLISSTEFTFILAHPTIGSPYISPLKFPFPITLKSKEEKTVSVWIEQMKYVKSGTLQIRSTKTVMVTDTVPQGKWNFVLTREPPL